MSKLVGKKADDLPFDKRIRETAKLMNDAGRGNANKGQIHDD